MDWSRPIEETSWRLTTGLGGLLTLFYFWLLVNMPQLRDIATVYLFLILVSVIGGGFAYAKVYPFGILSFPPIQEMPRPALVGALFGFIWYIFAGQMAWFSRLFQITIIEGVNPIIAYILLGFAIPFTEEAMFRALSIPVTINLLYENVPAAVLFTSFMFSALHWVTFQASPLWLFNAFLFSIGLSILTLWYRSAWPAAVAHIVYNLLQAYSILGVPF